MCFFYSVQVLESSSPDSVAIAKEAEPITIIGMFATPEPDWQGLWRFHQNAAKDAARSPQARRWHADQCRRVKARLSVQRASAFDWQALCADWLKRTPPPQSESAPL